MVWACIFLKRCKKWEKFGLRYQIRGCAGLIQLLAYMKIRKEGEPFSDLESVQKKRVCKVLFRQKGRRGCKGLARKKEYELFSIGD